MTLEEKLYVHKLEDALKRMEENFNSLQQLKAEIFPLLSEIIALSSGNLAEINEVIDCIKEKLSAVQ